MTVTSGSAILDPRGLGSTFDLHGTEGFSFVGESDDNSGVSCFPCLEGEAHDFSSLASGSYRATATLRGQTFVFDFDNGGGQLFFETRAITLPPQAGTSGIAELRLPFRLGSDSFLFFQPQPVGSNLGFQVAMRGSGTLTVLADFFNDPEFGTRYDPGELRYQFEPTPEPASLILLATGVGIACCRRNRGRSIS